MHVLQFGIGIEFLQYHYYDMPNVVTNNNPSLVTVFMILLSVW